MRQAGRPRQAWLEKIGGNRGLSTLEASTRTDSTMQHCLRKDFHVAFEGVKEQHDN